MPTTDTVRSTVHLDPQLHQALRMKAALSQRSMSDMVDEALREALRDDQEDLAAVRARSEEAAGSGLRKAQRRRALPRPPGRPTASSARSRTPASSSR